MKLRVRKIQVDAAGKTIAIINSKDASELAVHPLERIVLKKGRKKITAVVNLSKKFVKEGEIIVYNEIKKILNIKPGNFIIAEPRKELISKKYIRKKIEGKELCYNEFRKIIDNIINRDLNDLEVAAFITSLHIHGMSVNENYAIAKAMIDTSDKIRFRGIVADKHSIGGVPGDKTSIVLVPIVAAGGITIPKTSTRSITSPAGTADRVEVLMPVELDINKIKSVVSRTKACLVWGGAISLAPSDDLLIQIEKPLSLDPLLIPSVLAKKKVVGSKYIVIDIPTGPEAKVKTIKAARKIASKFIEVGRRLDMKIDCVITGGFQPIGYNIGPSLEAREALETIMNLKMPDDLINKAITLAGTIFRMTGKGNKQTALNILKSGKAEKKLREIIKAQGGRYDIQPDDIPYAKYKKEIKARKSGTISYIKNHILVEIAKIAGSPKYKLAGIQLSKKLGENVKKGNTLFTIYAEKKNKLRDALKIAKENQAYIIR